MKKRLLLALAFVATAFTGFAHEIGDFVTAVQGRYQVVGENLLPNGTFVDGFTGWTQLGELAPTDVLSYNGEGIVSLSNANTEGIYTELKGLNAGAIYLVSFTIGSQEVVPNQNTKHYPNDITAGANLIDIIGSSDGTIDGSAPAEEGTEKTLVNLAKSTEIFPGEAQTYSYAFKAEALTYFIKLAGIDANLVIKNITVHEVNEYADFRKAEGILDWAKKIKNAREWEESDEYTGLVELIDAVEGLMENPESTAEEFDAALLDLQAGIDEFTKVQMDDFLPNAVDKIPAATAKVSKASSIGIWKEIGNTGRVHADGAGAYYDLGHFQQSNSWGNGNGNIGLQTTIDLSPGVYVFSVNLKAACRENNKNSWTLNEGLSFAEGELYVNLMTEDGANVAEGGEKVATTGLYALSSSDLKRNTVVLNVETAGKYQFCMNTTAKEAYAGLKYGSVAYPFGASIYAKTAEKYSKAQLDYEKDVLGQITAGRDNITKANEYLADPAKSWGKEALKAAVDEFTPVIEKYEAMSQDDIIATYDEELYDASKGLEATMTEEGDDYYRILASDVYRNATKQLIAAVRDFENHNAVIDALTTAISNAEAARDTRMYTYATGKADLQAAIDAAKNIETAMRAGDYSEENEATVNEAIATLNDAVVVFKTTIPADKMNTIIDIDFSNAPALNEESALYEVKGAQGTMVLPSYIAPGEELSGTPYSNGLYSNGELILGDVLRVGSGSATVDLPAVADDAILVVTFDYYFGNLSGKKCGYKLVDTTVDPAGVVCGLNCSKYSNNDDLNTFAVNYNSNITAVGSSSAANDAIAAESNKTSFSVTLDLAAKTMECTIVSPKGTFPSESVAMPEGLKPTQFVLMSDYNNNDRRSWFDNLKIVTVDAGEYDGIKNVNTTNAVVAPVKSLVNGQVVIKTAKGTFTAAGAQVK